MTPSRLASLFVVFLLLAAPGHTYAQVQGEIRFEAARQGPTWLGQELELNLDLWSDGFNFGEQLFVLPEVKGAYLLQADSSTIKLSENRAGVQWQGLRYTFLLYPQKAGRLQVPSFEVSFISRAAYGADPASFRFSTPGLSIEARLPPGADGSGLIVTTTSFDMEASWSPVLPNDGPADLKVGDALTLEVERRAQDVPGMVFAPLPEFAIDGLGIYPGPAQVNDRINRGSLSGARTDSVTFVCEREGSYRVPELRFQWWDPVRETLSEKVIPARELIVAANPAYATGSETPARRNVIELSWTVFAAAAGLVWLLVFPVRRLARTIANRIRRAREKHLASPDWAFRQARKACATGAANEAYNAINAWLSRIGQGGARLTLMQLARQVGDEALLSEVTVLQQIVASGSADKWSGGKLAELLVQCRNHADEASKRDDGLHPLNPAPVRIH